MEIEPLLVSSIETSQNFTIVTVASTKACFQYRLIGFVASAMAPFQTSTHSFLAGNSPPSSLVEQMFHGNDGRGGRVFKRRRIIEGGDHVVTMEMEGKRSTNTLSDVTTASAQTPGVADLVVFTTRSSHNSTRAMQQSQPQASQRQQQQQSQTEYCYYCSCYYCRCRAVALGSTHVLTSA